MTGLFIQLSTTPPGSYLQDLVAHVRLLHPELTDLAFADCQPWDIARLDPLNLAGLNVYVGAPHIPWFGPRPDTPSGLQAWMLPVAGAAGMLTPSYRWGQIFADEALAQQTTARGWNVYIGSEVGIDALGDHPNLRAAWEAYLIEICKRVPGPKFLWSPYAWDAWATVSAFRRTRVQAAVKALVANVKVYSQTPGIGRIDLQDGRGAQPQEPASDATNWYRLIKDSGTTVKINMELFTPGLDPLPIDVMRARRSYYATQGVPVGCSWEARYWLVPLYANHNH
jgi:hypothetical protein